MAETLTRMGRSGAHRSWLPVLPALVVIVPLFAAAVVFALIQSFGYFPLIGQSAFTLDAYRSLLERAEFWQSLLLSLWIATAAAGLSSAVGVAAALALRRAARGRSRLAFALQINLPIPHVVGALAMVHLLGQSGLLARLGNAAGIIESPAQFPALVFDPWAFGIIAEFVWKDAPFIAIIALGVLGSSAPDYEDLASSLGASPWQRLRHVTLPLLAPAVAPASLIVYAFSFGSFEVPLLLGESFPSALSVLAYRLHTNVDLAARPEGMALSVMMSLVVMAAASGYLWLVGRGVRRRRT